MSADTVRCGTATASRPYTPRRTREFYRDARIFEFAQRLGIDLVELQEGEAR